MDNKNGINTETMTVHRVLAELKTIDKRIEKKIREISFCTANRHSNTKIHGIAISDYINKAKEDYASVFTLINRREAMKKALTHSNAVTVIDIAGKQYTIAEAIEMKNTGILNKLSLLADMEKQYANATAIIERENATENLLKKADENVAVMFGSKEKIDSDEVTKIREAYIKNNSYELVDPLGVVSIIDKLQKETDTFMSEVDAAISVSNALTTIEFSYDVM